MSLFKDWFRIGPLGPHVAVPLNRFGWLTSLGLTLPALAYALAGGGVGRILAGGLFAFVFGFSYAVAGETARESPPAAALAEPGAETADQDETPLAA